MTTTPADPLALVVVNNGLDVSENAPLIQPFIEFLSVAEIWKERVSRIKVTDVSDTAGMKVARESRLALKNVRVEANKVRIRLKEESLKRGKMIDGLYAVIDGLVSPLEADLLAQEEFAERAEASRRAALKTSREALLRPFNADTSFYALGDMNDETFKDLFDGLKTAAENKAEQLRAAEAVRIQQEAAERERQNALRIENERLKAEKVAAEAKATAEREAQQAVIDRQNAEAKAAKDAADRVAREKQTEIDAANARARKVEQDAAAERKRAADAQAKRVRELQEEARRAAMAPDREKILELAKQVRSWQLPEMLTADGINAQIDIMDHAEKFAEYIESLAAKF